LVVRVGVLGCGLIAQAMHLPFLAQLRDFFRIAALVAPSATVRNALALVYVVDREYERLEQLLSDGGIDALLVCSPNGTHAATYERRLGGQSVQIFRSYEESYRRELVHFHHCVTAGEECRTPPEQARVDIEVLTEMFFAASQGANRFHQPGRGEAAS
jgi:predicted dehydrogenase